MIILKNMPLFTSKVTLSWLIEFTKKIVLFLISENNLFVALLDFIIWNNEAFGEKTYQLKFLV